ncbi:MAG: isopenicillin N synthase family oxygenase [Crocinitomicaceae bacterium TMED114]|nr:MAG: isopenicillin N synthase family oxygenase [Crocinitomicaceae bacterium TMED114]RPG81551.1 MAG: isopenicillin N synthase family oxygenase [Crocinitomicaceae bacterium TMED114]
MGSGHCDLGDRTERLGGNPLNRCKLARIFALMPKAIPLLDAGRFLQGDDAARTAFAQDLRDAFSRYGFVTLEGHGLDADLIQQTYQSAASFFGLPVEQKMASQIPGVGGNFGYTPFGQEHAKDEARADLKEFYHFAQTHYTQPDCAAVPEFTKGGQKLYADLEALAIELLKAVAMGLDLPEDHFTEQVKGGNSILRVLHYPPAPDAPADAPRAGSHEDINLITLLVGSSADGLEVLDMDGDWIPVRAHSQHLTVNVGDMLQNFTGGVLRSTTHRVVLPEGEGRSKSRFSLPFFLHPQGSMPLDPVMGDREAHPCWTAEAFLNHRLKEIGLS